MSRTPEHVRSARKACTKTARTDTAAVFDEVLAESGITVAYVARCLELSESHVQRWRSGEALLPAYVLRHPGLPEGFRERLGERIVNRQPALSAPSTLHLVHVAAAACATLTAENDNARPAIAKLHDATSRWLRAKEAA